MSINRVPPVSGSPYQNCAGESVKPESTNPAVRQRVVGEDASLVPFMNRQIDSMGMISAPEEIETTEKELKKNRLNALRKGKIPDNDPPTIVKT
jgi:hypothetical protein